MSLVHGLLDDAAAAFGPRPSLREGAVTKTWAELARDSQAIAAWLHAQGVRRGDRVALLLPNGIELVTALFATSRLGALYSPLHPGLKPKQLEYVLGDMEPAVVVTTPELERLHGLQGFPRRLVTGEAWAQAVATPGIAPLPPFISSDPVSLLYTSGSTGRPKAVISTHRNVVFAARAIQSCLGYQAGDVIGSYLPLSFDYGLYQVFLACLSGATLALGNPDRAVPGMARSLVAWGATVVPLVPTLATALIELSKRLPQKPPIRAFTNTGAHLSKGLIEGLAEQYPRARTFVMFGITECKRVSILDPDDYATKPDSVGKPLPDTECLIVDDQGRPLPPGARGELVVRGPHVMLGYWRAPELTAKRYRPYGPGHERALFTGDTCSLDADGYLHFHGRTDDIYKQGGHRVSALEVEAAALDIAGIAQAALVLGGEQPVLHVVGTLDVDAVLRGLRDRLEDHKIPPRVERREAMPLTGNGKIDKAALR